MENLRYIQAILKKEDPGVLDENWLFNIFEWVKNKIVGSEEEVERIAKDLEYKSKEELKRIILSSANKLGMTREDLEDNKFLVGAIKENEDSISPNYIAYSFGKGVGYLLFLLASVIFIIGTSTILSHSIAFVLKVILCFIWAKLILD